MADIRALESAAAPSRIANALYGVRHVLGRLFDWDRVPMRPEESLLSRLSERDRRDSEITPGTRDGPFLLLYQFPGEALSETRNATVHGYVCTALARTATGYRLYWGVYVRPVSRLTRPYLIAIEPFGRFILYPAMLRRIRRAWLWRGSLRAALPARRVGKGTTRTVLRRMAIGHWLAFELTVVVRGELTVAGSTSTNVVST